ncbi:MAG: FAD-binding oxidoreductase [bacterium]|nr:FAD-binding oxidoreductase [bacterium]
MENKITKTKLLKKETLTSDVYLLRTQKPEGFIYVAGQFAQFLIPDPNNPNKLLKRSYSLCSIPSDDYLEFYIKVLPDGIGSDYIRYLKEGDTLDMCGPFGTFVLNIDDAPICLIATGVGVAPIIGVLRAALNERGFKSNIHLLFGLRNERGIFLTEMLDELKNKYSNFNYTLTLSRPSDEWNGKKGRVTAHFDEIIRDDCHYYICGNPDMVTDTRKLLEEKGVEKERTHFEMF